MIRAPGYERCPGWRETSPAPSRKQGLAEPESQPVSIAAPWLRNRGILRSSPRCVRATPLPTVRPLFEARSAVDRALREPGSEQTRPAVRLDLTPRSAGAGDRRVLSTSAVPVGRVPYS